jgi:hypothetical protein
MRKLIKIFLILFSTNCISQSDTKVLIVPLKNDMITLNSQVIRMINYNNVKIDSVKKLVQDLSIDRLNSQFPNYTFTNIASLPDYYYLLDSLDIFNQWNSFQIKKINESKGINRVLLENDQDQQLKYFGRIISKGNIEVYKKLQREHNFKYIFFINKFETISRNGTSICLHFEIYDENLNKVFGGKSYYSNKITRTMYYDVFKYFIQNALDDFYTKVGRFIQ